MNEQLKRFILGNRQGIAGTVYGTIIVMATLVAGAPAFRDKLWNFFAVVVVTTLVFWAAHIYAHGLEESLQLRRRLTAAELGQIARRGEIEAQPADDAVCANRCAFRQDHAHAPSREKRTR